MQIEITSKLGLFFYQLVCKVDILCVGSGGLGADVAGLWCRFGRVLFPFTTAAAGRSFAASLTGV